MPTNLQNLRKDLTEMKIFLKVLGELLFLKHPVDVPISIIINEVHMARSAVVSVLVCVTCSFIRFNNSYYC